MLRVGINYRRDPEVEKKADMGEKIGQAGLGLLRIAFGKTLKVTKVNSKLQFENKSYSTALRVGAAALAILALPLTVTLAGIGLIALAASRSHRVIHSYWENSLYPPYVVPGNAITHDEDKCIIHHKSEGKYVLITKAPPIENLVISGGGAKGVILVGAIEAFEKEGVRAQIKRVAGSSIGAVTAALFAAGLSAEAIRRESAKQDFNALLGSSEHWLGLYKDGNPLLQFLRDSIHNGVKEVLDETAPFHLIQKEPVTFKMLRQLHQWKPETFKELTVTVTNTMTGKTEYLNVDTAPDIEIALACRASASLPGVLAPVEINGQKYVDGGYLDNIPVKQFETGKEANQQTLVLVFDSTGSKEGEQSPFWSVKTGDNKIYKPSLLDKFMRDFVARKLAGIQTSERNTTRKQESLEDVRERYMQRNIPLMISLGTRDFKKAKKYEKEYREAGFRQASNYLKLHKSECMHYTFDQKKDLDDFLAKGAVPA